MAHDADKRREVRQRFIHEGQSLLAIAMALGLPETTLRRWKRDAEKDGDDWDLARSASMIAGDGLDKFVSQNLNQFIGFYQKTMDDLRQDAEIHITEKVKLMTSLADAFAKTVASAGRIAPKISELGVAMDVLKRLADFTAKEFPEECANLLMVLEPFGAEIAREYGARHHG